MMHNEIFQTGDILILRTFRLYVAEYEKVLYKHEYSFSFGTFNFGDQGLQGDAECVLDLVHVPYNHLELG